MEEPLPSRPPRLQTIAVPAALSLAGEACSPRLGRLTVWDAFSALAVWVAPAFTRQWKIGNGLWISKTSLVAELSTKTAAATSLKSIRESRPCRRGGSPGLHTADRAPGGNHSRQSYVPTSTRMFSDTGTPTTVLGGASHDAGLEGLAKSPRAGEREGRHTAPDRDEIRHRRCPTHGQMTQSLGETHQP